MEGPREYPDVSLVGERAVVITSTVSMMMPSHIEDAEIVLSESSGGPAAALGQPMVTLPVHYWFVWAVVYQSFT